MREGAGRDREERLSGRDEKEGEGLGRREEVDEDEAGGRESMLGLAIMSAKKMRLSLGWQRRKAPSCV